MKKALLFVAVTGMCVAGFAQDKGFHVGLSGTFNSTWILNQNNYGTLEPFKQSYVKQSEMDYTATWGGNAGVCVGYKFNKLLGLQAEVQYNVTGQKYEDAFEGPAYVPAAGGIDTLGSASTRVNVKRQIKLGYLQIPLLFKLTAGKSSKAKFLLAIGPQVGFRTSAYEKVEVGGLEYNDLPYTPKEKFRPVDAGLALQLGAEVYPTEYLLIDIAINAYGGFADLNGKAMQKLEWYSKNDVSYQKSYNFRGGLMVGLHYLFIKHKDKERLQF